MASINKAIISGNLTRDAEMRSTSNGTAVLGFSVAVNDRRKNAQTGEWEDVPNFIDCTMFGSRAEGIAPYLTKGAKVCIEGKLRWSQWERDGDKRSKLEVIVEEIVLMSARSGSQPQYAPQPTTYPQQPQPPAYGTQNGSQGYQQPAQMAMNMAQQQPPLEAMYDEPIPF